MTKRKGALALAMVALAKRVPLDLRAIAKELEQRFGLEGTVSTDGDPGTISVEGGEAIFATMPAPIPAPDLKAACERSYFWPEAAQTLEGHEAHLIVTVMGEEGTPPQDLALLLTRAVAAACSENAVAVYWGSAGIVHEPASFVEDAEGASEEQLPAHLWVALVPFAHGGKRHVATRGMETFGQREIEALIDGPRAPRLLEFLPDFVGYLLASGPIVGDGDTIGGSAAEKFKVRFKKSVVDAKNEVMFLQG